MCAERALQEVGVSFPEKIRNEAHMIEVIMSRLARVGECEVYQGTKSRKGYGRIEALGKAHAVHRAVWSWSHGPIPDGMLVCHHCDNPSCVRLEHLFLATNDENMADMLRKGRAKSRSRLAGERNPQSKTSDTDVRLMREKFAAGATTVALAAEYGLTRGGVWQIVKGSLRLAAGGPIAPRGPRKGGPRGGKTKLSRAALIAVGAVPTTAPIHPNPLPVSQARTR